MLQVKEPSTQPTTFYPIVFYDGACPLCKKEIAHYRRIDKNNAINWVDISTDTRLLTGYNISFTEAMKKLHVIDSDHKIKIGIDAFLTIWQWLPYYQFLGKTITLLKLKKPMSWAYDIFAKHRYKKSMQHQLCATSCKAPEKL